MIAILGACLLAATASLGAQPAPSAQAQPPERPTISTTGHASIKVAPDLAWLTVTAETRANSTSDAQRLNAQAIAATRANLVKAGVKDEAVRTAGYAVEPQMQYTDGTSKVVGYVARQQLDVRVDDLDRLGAVIDAAGAQGATTISNIRYDLKDRTSVENQALDRAVRDGLARADVIAKAARKVVTGLQRIDDQRIINNAPSPVMYAMKAGGAGGRPAPTEIEVNEIEVVAQVTISVFIG